MLLVKTGHFTNNIATKENKFSIQFSNILIDNSLVLVGLSTFLLIIFIFLFVVVGIMCFFFKFLN